MLKRNFEYLLTGEARAPQSLAVSLKLLFSMNFNLGVLQRKSSAKKRDYNWVTWMQNSFHQKMSLINTWHLRLQRYFQMLASHNKCGVVWYECQKEDDTRCFYSFQFYFISNNSFHLRFKYKNSFYRLNFLFIFGLGFFWGFKNIKIKLCKNIQRYKNNLNIVHSCKSFILTFGRTIISK